MRFHPLRLLLLVLLPAAGLHASRSGLNNVPTADVSAPRVAVMHLYSAFGPGRDASFLAGVHTGWKAGEHGFEAGLDSRWAPGPDVPAFLNAKRRLPGHRGWPALAIGAAGVAPRAADRHRLNPWLGIEVAQNHPVERGRDYSTAELALYLGF